MAKPIITINVGDIYSAVVKLSATKNESVNGELKWEFSLGSEYIQVDGNNLVFINAYQGTITLKVSSDNASSEKTVNVNCNYPIVASVYSINGFEKVDDADYLSTRAQITHTVKPCYYYKLSLGTNDDTSKEYGSLIYITEEVIFEKNLTDSDITRSGSSKDIYGVSYQWEILQKCKPINTITAIYETTESNENVLLFNNTLDSTNCKIYISEAEIEFSNNYSFELQGTHSVRYIIEGNITDMSHMFDGCEKLKSVSFSSIDSSNVKDLNSLFKDCFALNSVDFQGFSANECKDMSHMFENCLNISELNLGEITAEKVENFDKMFCNCMNIKTLDLSLFNVLYYSSVRDIFKRCGSLTQELNVIYNAENGSKLKNNSTNNPTYINFEEK